MVFSRTINIGGNYYYDKSGYSEKNKKTGNQYPS